MGEEDEEDLEDSDDAALDEDDLEGSDGSDDDISDVSSEIDSVFGSDLDADDEDLGDMRKKAGRRGGGARYVDVFWETSTWSGGGGGGRDYPGVTGSGGLVSWNRLLDVVVLWR